MIRSPAERQLEEWPLHEINLQINTKQVIIIDGVTTRVNGELG
jgi:hypothetical protein